MNLAGGGRGTYHVLIAQEARYRPDSKKTRPHIGGRVVGFGAEQVYTESRGIEVPPNSALLGRLGAVMRQKRPGSGSMRLAVVAVSEPRGHDPLEPSLADRADNACSKAGVVRSVSESGTIRY
jgi:hypothetical protein